MKNTVRITRAVIKDQKLNVHYFELVPGGEQFNDSKGPAIVHPDLTARFADLDVHLATLANNMNVEKENQQRRLKLVALSCLGKMVARV